MPPWAWVALILLFIGFMYILFAPNRARAAEQACDAAYLSAEALGAGLTVRWSGGQDHRVIALAPSAADAWSFTYDLYTGPHPNPFERSQTDVHEQGYLSLAEMEVVCAVLTEADLFTIAKRFGDADNPFDTGVSPVYVNVLMGPRFATEHTLDAGSRLGRIVLGITQLLSLKGVPIPAS